MQEMLDVRAVAAGLKPAAFLGFETPVAGPPPGMVGTWISAWVSRGELDDVPAWYAEAVRAEKALMRVLLVFPAKAAIPSSAASLFDMDPSFRRDDELGVEAEAAMLGYPACCVADHAFWRAAVHRRSAELTLEAAGGDVARAARLAAAGWQPPFNELEMREFAPHTSILMCPACAADPDSPARRLGRAYAALA